MKRLEIKVEVDYKGKITMDTTNDGFTEQEVIGLLELKKMEIGEQCMNPQRFTRIRRYKDEDGKWVEVKKGGTE